MCCFGGKQIVSIERLGEQVDVLKCEINIITQQEKKQVSITYMSQLIITTLKAEIFLAQFSKKIVHY